MLHLLRKLFCIHVYEYEQLDLDSDSAECRKCGAHKH